MGRRQQYNNNNSSSSCRTETGRHLLRKGASGASTRRRVHRRPEKLVDNSRRMEDKGTTHVDNPQAISLELASSAARKAFLLRITTENAHDGGTGTFVGQAGLLRGRQLTASPPAKRRALENSSVTPHPAYRSRYEAVPTTCIHNAVTEANDQGVLEKYVRSTLVGPIGHQYEVTSFSKGGILTKSITQYKIREFDQNGEGGIEWKCGIDVDTAAAIGNEASHFCKKECTFQKMERADFKFCVGQKIAMAVFRDYDIDPEDTGVPTITPEKIIEVFGEKNEVNIYTGEIKRVTDDNQCFEHDINSFCGCSGAVVFLLDQQPNDVGVLEEDYGKAIAVHAGGDDVDEGVVRNFAFKI